MEHNLLNSIDIQENFWLQNPHTLVIKEFKDLHTNDKSKNKEDSSKTMWCLFMLRDQSSSNKLRNMTIEDKIIELSTTYYKADWDQIQTLYDTYDTHCSSYAHRRLGFWKDQLEERETYIKSLRYGITGDEDDRKEKMLSSVFKLWQDYEKAERMVKEEDNKTETKGQRRESATERGDL